MKEITEMSSHENLIEATIRLGEDTEVEDEAVVGYRGSRMVNPVLTIGDGGRIRRGTIIYVGSYIGINLETGHNVIIREENEIGDNFRIWNNSVIDYGCRIGNNVKIHNKVYIAQKSIIEDDVFIAPGVTFANDMHPGCPEALQCMLGPHICRGVQIGVNSTLLPRVTVGENTLIGAGSVVTRDLPPGIVAYGNPARVMCRLEDLNCETGLTDKPYTKLFFGVK